MWLKYEQFWNGWFLQYECVAVSSGTEDMWQQGSKEGVEAIGSVGRATAGHPGTGQWPFQLPRVIIYIELSAAVEGGVAPSSSPSTHLPLSS